MMKKTLALSLALLLGGSALVSAASMNLALILDSDIPNEWGYAQNTDIEVIGFNVEEGMNPEIADKDFVIKTPVLIDEKNQEVQEYTIFLSHYPINKLLDGEDKFQYRDEVVQLPAYKIDELVGYSELRIPPTEDGISIDRYYYGFVVPSDNNGDLGDRSSEFCFNFSTEEYEQGDACTILGVKTVKSITEATFEPFAGETDETATIDGKEEVEHGAANGPQLTDISHTVDFTGKVITLTWTAIPGADAVEITFFGAKEEPVLVNMLDEKYEYHYNDSMQEFIFMLTPVGGVEKRYELNVRHETQESVTIEKVPTVGPVEDMLMIFGVAVLLYGGYVALRSKAKAEK